MISIHPIPRAGLLVEGFREGMHLASVRDAVVRNNSLYNQLDMAIWRTGAKGGGTNGINLTIENNDIYNPMFGSVKEYDAYGGNDGKHPYVGINRAGNPIVRPDGNPQPYKGASPVTS